MAIKTPWVWVHEKLEAAGIHGSTTAATANKLVHRDANGRISCAAPISSGQAAVKANVDDHAAIESLVHGSTAIASANKLVHRDSSSRARVADPAVDADIDTKGARDTAIGTHGALTTGVHGVGAGTIAKVADIVATKLDDFTAPDDNTELNASTTKHGLMPKGTATANHYFKSDNGQGALHAATDSLPGAVELATAAEVNTGTDATRAVTPDGLAGANVGIRYLQALLFDIATDCETGDGKMYWHIPPAMDGMNLVYCHAEVITAGTTGTMDIQVRNVDNALDMLSTKLTIDTAETGSDTAATPYAINGSNDHVNTNDVIRADVDAVHTTAAKGLILTLGFQLP